MIKLSIITVNFNNLSGLQRTMQSVLNQTYVNMEYIVVDGGSTDGSKDYIERNQEKLSYWCSEKDKGIYDGMNKGIAQATGDYVLFLNSGDTFCDSQVLDAVFRNRTIASELIVGRQYHVRSGKRRASRRIFAWEVDEQFLISNTLPHQATFIQRSLLQKVGGYNLDYRIVADWVFWYEAVVKREAMLECVDTFVADMEEEGLSGNVDNCHTEMAHYLSNQHPVVTIDLWKLIIQQNNDAYMYNRARRGWLGKLLVRMALRLYK